MRLTKTIATIMMVNSMSLVPVIRPCEEKGNLLFLKYCRFPFSGTRYQNPPPHRIQRRRIPTIVARHLQGLVFGLHPVSTPCTLYA